MIVRRDNVKVADYTPENTVRFAPRLEYSSVRVRVLFMYYIITYINNDSLDKKCFS